MRTLHNLPPQVAALLGRAAELEAVRQRLVGDGARLLTVTGTAGVGKTRLAVAAAESLLDAFDDGVWFVDLTPVSESTGVLPRIASVLGLRAAGRKVSQDENVRLYLRQRRLLLVLDNCERVLGAGPDLGALLEVCPGVTILATSREPLRVRWERLYPLQPLATPPAEGPVSPEALERVPSVALFVERARDVKPDFHLDADNADVTAELCRRLDGLPLAIELAAARSRALPPGAILSRLERRLDLLVGGRRDEPARHQTIRAALGWSYDLLSSAEQTLFRRLSVFRGGLTLEAAEAVCDVDAADGIDALDGMESLVNRGLLKQEESASQPRFGMLETVHAYALEALEATGEVDTVKRRHAGFYCRLVERAAVELCGPDQMRWLGILDRELSNIRAAILWLTRQAEGEDVDATELGLRISGSLWWYIHVRGIYSEGGDLVGPLLRTNAARGAAGWGQAQATLGVTAWGLGEYETARRLHEESLAWYRAHDDQVNAAQALIDLGCVALSHGDERAAEFACAEALELATAMGDEWKCAWALTFQGMLAIAQGDLATAARKHEAALQRRRHIGDVFGQAWASNGLATVARLRGDAATARPLYEDAMITFRALGERPTVASILDGLGELALAERAYGEARARFGESLLLYRDMDSRRGIGIALSGFATVAAAEGRAERAVRLAGAATALHDAGGGAMELLRPRDASAWLEEARSSLGQSAAGAAWAAGLAMSADQAVREALAADTQPPTQAPRLREMPLTAREQEVARLVAQGASNRRIAEVLVIGERTAEAHVSNILAKLGLETRVQLAAWTVARGLADPLPA